MISTHKTRLRHSLTRNFQGVLSARATLREGCASCILRTSASRRAASPAGRGKNLMRSTEALAWASTRDPTFLACPRPICGPLRSRSRRDTTPSPGPALLALPSFTLSIRQQFQSLQRHSSFRPNNKPALDLPSPSVVLLALPAPAVAPTPPSDAHEGSTAGILSRLSRISVAPVGGYRGGGLGSQRTIRLRPRARRRGSRRAAERRRRPFQALFTKKVVGMMSR